jgi:hypothetical protein
LQGGLVIHPGWVLETEALAGPSHPLLTVVSRRLLEDRLATYDTLREGGYTDLVVYMAQQIHQFRLHGKEFAMQHRGVNSDLVKVMRDIWDTLDPDEREKVFGFRDEWQGLSPRERLRGLSAEEMLQGLTPEQAERLRQLLQSQTKPDDPSRPE